MLSRSVIYIKNVDAEPNKFRRFEGELKLDKTSYGLTVMNNYVGGAELDIEISPDRKVELFKASKESGGFRAIYRGRTKSRNHAPDCLKEEEMSDLYERILKLCDDSRGSKAPRISLGEGEAEKIRRLISMYPPRNNL